MNTLASSTVQVGHAAVPAGLILIVIAIICLVMLGRSERGSVLWFAVALILGVLLAAAFPVIAADINTFFYSL